MMLAPVAGTTPALFAILENGKAHNMGCGVVLIDQLDETQPRGRRRQRVVLSYRGLSLLVTGGTLSVTLEDGRAEYMGDGLWVIDQVDETQKGLGRFQRIVLGEADLEALRALAA